ncbi:asparagine synthase (glutamine-hydrolyzing) [bacterium]|nr:asparagine synthase (glutamine-hydrolyzing) [bacterium]
MCGIAGLIDPSLSTAQVTDRVRGAVDALVHRGPDDQGTFCEEGVGIGIRRLSIIDVEGGHQPIANEAETVHVVCNGEIYNYLDLRKELETRGHVFKTRSDVEVIVHLYEEYGTSCVDHLVGMFGIALWDSVNRRLFLGRDRLGKKPLYYAERSDTLVFGSEIKAILEVYPDLAEPDRDSLIPYLRYGLIPEPHTIYRGIRNLPAGHWMVYEGRRSRIQEYWRPDPTEDTDRSYDDWKGELDALLLESVRSRLMSEVPLGVFLSGGIDSSAVVAYAHQAGLHPLKTFTIGFDRGEWDESGDAETVARHFGTEHHVLRVAQTELEASMADTLVALVRGFDEPFGDSSALPTYHVSRLAGEHVRVILGGDGGDELFAGYSSYRGIRFAEFYRQLPAWLGQGLLPSAAGAVASALPRGRRYAAQRVQKVFAASGMAFADMYFSKQALCSDDLISGLLSTPIGREERPDTSISGIRQVLSSEAPAVNKATYADIRFRLLEDMLVKVDRMSMAHSLEVRSPFLDHRLVEFALAIPPALKLRGWETKAILRDTVRGYLPRSTVQKKKQGFGVPLREWFKTGLHEMVGDYLESEPGGLPADTFDRKAVRQLVARHQKGEADYSQVIWMLLNYATWHDLYVSRSSARF